MIPNPSRRSDIPFERAAQLDASGNYEGQWIDSASIQDVRVAVRLPAGTTGSPYVAVHDGMYYGDVDADFGSGYGDIWTIRETQVPAAGGRYVYGTVPIVGRWFRVVIYGVSQTSDIAAIAVRSV